MTEQNVAPEQQTPEAADNVEAEGQVEGTEEQQGGEDAAPDTPAEPKIELTQQQIDDMIEARLARERKKAEDEKRKASMSAAERAKAEKEEADTRAESALSEAKQARLEVRAERAAMAEGVREERMAAVMRLADFEGVEFEGTVPNAEAVTAAVNKVLEDFPEFKQQQGEQQRRTAPDATQQRKGVPTKEDVKKMSFEDRMELYNRDPALYNSLTVG